MTKNNLLKKDIPAKIYLLAYPKPIIQEEISLAIYGTTKRQGYISDVIRRDQKMVERGYLKEIKNKKKKVGYLSKAQPLADQIESDLKDAGHPLDIVSSEKKKLIEFLDGTFRNHIHPSGGLRDFTTPWEYFRFTIGFRALLAWHQSRYHDIDNMDEEKKKTLLQDNRIAPFIILGKKLDGKLAHLLPPDEFKSPLDALILQRDLLRDMLRSVKLQFPKTKPFIDEKFEEANNLMQKLSSEKA